MRYRFVDLVDIDAFCSMLTALYDATGILHGLVDDENHVISAAGWQEACTAFHRSHPDTLARCLESNRDLSARIGSAPYVGVRCGNGLMDYAAAIVVEGRQLATLYFGQCLHEPPDLEFFRALARDCGFDEQAYLAAIRKVPIVARERVEAIMRFYAQLAQMLAQTGLDRLRLREAERGLEDANRDLARRVEERTAELAAKNAELLLEIDERRRTEEARRTSQGTLEAILDASPVGVGWSRAGDIEYVNRRFTELFGYELGDLPTMEQWLASAFPDDVLRDGTVRPLLEDFATLRRSGEARFTELPLVCKDGSRRHVATGLSWAGDRQVGIFMDVTDRWLADRRQEANRASLEMIAKGAPLSQTLRTVIRGLQAEHPELLCTLLLPQEDLGVRSDASPGAALVPVEPAGSGGAAATPAPAFTHHPSCPDAGKEPACWAEPVQSSRGEELGVLSVCPRPPHPATEAERLAVANALNLAAIAVERHRANAELERRAYTDVLTGLPNRRRFLEVADAELLRAQRFHQPAALLMVDIDHFKRVNDTYGHDAGDLVLRIVAATARASLRQVDTLGRLGGEEFAVVLPQSDLDQAAAVAERLRLAVAAANIELPSTPALHVTISIGVAPALAGTSLAALLARADQALYEAKHGGRNRVCRAVGLAPAAAVAS